MGFSKFDWYTGGIVYVFSLLVILVWSVMSSSWDYSLVGGLVGSSYFCFDSVSLYLVLLSVFLWMSLLFLFNIVSLSSKVLITLSVMCSLVSYCCVHSLVFWVFYEMSILLLLLLLVLESPYSERYIASWYLLGYVVLTSLPMLLCIFYLSFNWGSFNLRFWFDGYEGCVSSGVFAVLAVMFITKVPLPPFHVWLPIVHAEASSIVSVCLSGYIMKLGVLGICRFCSYLLSNLILSNTYMIVALLLAILFFFSATRELDGKRWLAFLSLSHIIIAAVCLCVVGFEGSSLAFVFSLGHGLSAGVTFIFLWLAYEVSGSRNWNVLKYCLSSSLFMRCLVASCLCTVASLPPTLQFFSEVFILSEAGVLSSFFICAFYFYLFCSGLVPLFLIGSLLSRHYSISFAGGGIWCYFSSMLFLIVWSFVCFVVI
uniref:NADH-ubiquinone oxidoreductase chain 4 n=1 Tax=Calicophoron microbothrioides TaxID=154335 RepID=A0A0G3F9K8_CALMO|nr:NADH dehydrogenase subunit 4 [Calicophoron microbothrioides]AKJ83398.1 NADH dehydrogenase subunit 4 [Calicophoron microbothrioides]